MAEFKPLYIFIYEERKYTLVMYSITRGYIFQSSNLNINFILEK